MSDWLAYLPWRTQFANVMDERFYTLAWLDEEVRSGRARCWADDRGAIIATLRTYPAGAVEVHGLIAAGELDAVKALIPLAEAWGCENGAIVASIASRAGWSRALSSDGYAVWQTELRKELPDGVVRLENFTDLHA